MRIQVSDESVRDDLATYLRAGAYDVTSLGPTLLSVDDRRGRNADETRDRLRVYLATWRAMHPGTAVDLLD